MNLRNAGDYSVGLDIGTGSVGWAVVDENGELYKFKGKNTWGSRLFDSASTAAGTRQARILRRRYARRYRRIQDLREFMLPDIVKVDPEFFCRLNQSDLWEEDRDFSGKSVLFTPEGPDADKAYYKRFPTIYHLRQHLIESDQQEDIRLVYLALHHMMKYRGHFLVDGELSAANADAKPAIASFVRELGLYCDAMGIEYDSDQVDTDALEAAFSSTEPRRFRQERFSAALHMPASAKKIQKAFGDAAFGYQANFGAMFGVEENGDSKFSLDKDDKVAKFEDEMVPEEFASMFAALQALYNAYLLSGIMSDAQGGTVSASMVNRYEQHKADLAHLKALVAKYFPNEDGAISAQRKHLFRGPRYSDGTYKKEGAAGYTGYILGKVSKEDFYKDLKNIFSGVSMDSEDAEYWNAALRKMDDGTYLRKLRVSENGAIPHQFHLEEMRAIIAHQSAYYPTLAEHGDEICQLLSFRLPYYVGPLGKEVNPKRAKPFGWAVRMPGMENTPVKPWNFEEVIDKDACAEAFITNLTGECSYYLGKKVIPKYSLLYSEFCVRQELNVCKNDIDGEHFARMDNETVESIFENVFKRHKKVKVSHVEEHLRSLFGTHYKIKGTQKENEFASSLTSYCDFSQILGRPIETYADYDMVENLITWVTVFEDKKILKRKIDRTYGPRELGGNGALSADQVKRVCKLRYTGWSNLSREFLEELRADYQGRSVSVMDILRDSGKTTPMNLMEILADERFGFKGLLDAVNQEFLRDQQGYLLEDIPGSPAIKRGINQSLKIVEEIASIAGKPPAKICVEVAREEVGKTKGSRTKSREKQLNDLYSAITKDMPLYQGQSDLKHELSKHKDQLDGERLYLYFLQRGRSAYSGKSLKIEDLHLYHVDHIVPQSMVKDDSIDNKVLVLQSENEQKRDVYPLPEDLRRSCYRLWVDLHDAKLMSDKKFNALTAEKVTDRQAKGFINRQLVETRQITKHVVTLLQSLYPESTVETVKAELTSNLRTQYGFYKSREINDWHHAHDAFLACQISRFVSIRFPRISEDFDYRTFSRFAMATKGSTKGHSGLIVNSFGVNGFDPETGEVFRDAWYGEHEIERIRKCLNYKDCFVSRKVEILTGEFWNQTVYSPRMKSDNAIPLKAGKSLDRYGHYMSPNSAFYTLIEHTRESRGKKKREVSLIGIPVNVSYMVGDDAAALQSYLETRYEEPRILKQRVPKYQKIEWSGVEYYLTSSSEMINARQLWLPEKYVDLLWFAGSKRLNEDDRCRLEACADELFEHLINEIGEEYPRYQGVCAKLSASSCRGGFKKKDLAGKVASLQEIISMLHCNASYGLKGIGLAATAGRMNMLNIGGAVSDIVFIDSSVTGMFERRYRIEL